MSTEDRRVNELSENPYASPTADALQPTTTGRSSVLRPLWTWLAIAAIVSFLCTPADLLSQLVALAYGLSFFCIGSILASSLHIILRMLPLVLWVPLAGWLVLEPFGQIMHTFLVIGAVFYAVISVACGFWAHRTIQNGRLRILASFYIGYVLGSFFGILGTVAGAALATLLANRSLRIRVKS